MPKPTPQEDQDGRSQGQKFADLARELECEESEEGFDDRLKGVARAPRASESKENPPS